MVCFIFLVYSFFYYYFLLFYILYFFFADWLQRLAAAVPRTVVVVRPETPGALKCWFPAPEHQTPSSTRGWFPRLDPSAIGFTRIPTVVGADRRIPKFCVCWPRAELAAAHAWSSFCVALGIQSAATRLNPASAPWGKLRLLANVMLLRQAPFFFFFLIGV